MLNKLLTVLILGAVFSGCGPVSLTLSAGSDGPSVTVSANTPSLVADAKADITSCSSGMTLYPTVTGVSAFCIDDSTNGTTAQMNDHPHASGACLNSGKSLCTFIQLKRAYVAGALGTSRYWSRDSSGLSNGDPANGAINGADGTFWGFISAISTTKANWYCCSQ